MYRVTAAVEIRAEIEAAAQAPNGNLPDGAYGHLPELDDSRRSSEAEGGALLFACELQVNLRG